mgnify:CR=1 FL=1
MSEDIQRSPTDPAETRLAAATVIKSISVFAKP